MIARTDIEAELDCAQQISGQLEAARQARGLSQKEVAYQLMLSADQVNCLESRSLKSFYSPRY
ncbi:MAG: helix-turn-helix domain-containing protein, partial [Ferrovum sp.]|nr:helix-turn-helix domain-containing protein [Ferrovum sp.]